MLPPVAVPNLDQELPGSMSAPSSPLPLRMLSLSQPPSHPPFANAPCRPVPSPLQYEEADMSGGGGRGGKRVGVLLWGLEVLRLSEVSRRLQHGVMV